MSKGDRPRPYSVSLNTFDNNWDNIFKKDYTAKSDLTEVSTVDETVEDPADSQEKDN